MPIDHEPAAINRFDKGEGRSEIRSGLSFFNSDQIFTVTQMGPSLASPFGTPGPIIYRVLCNTPV